MDLYAVIGNPITHSKSPRIHAMFAQACSEAMEYTAIQAPLDGFAAVVKEFFAHNGKGLNVTVPFKEQAWRLVDERRERAQRAGAVNTLLMENGRLVGDNTDGVGLVRDICVNQGFSIAEKRLLVLGAGGAVRGVLQLLLEQAPAQLVIANRTLAKAEELVQLFAPFGAVEACAFEELQGAFDLIINGTSASLAGDLPPIPQDVVAHHSWVYDMMYSPQETIFNQWARLQGAVHVIDGLGMLVEQAAEAFYIWRGVRPETAPVLQRLRQFEA